MDKQTKRIIEKMNLNTYYPLVANNVFVPYDPELVQRITQTGRDIINATTMESDSQKYS